MTDATLAEHPHTDPRGTDWQDRAAAAWDAAQGDLDAYHATGPELPDFAQDAPPHVSREVFGGYLYDPATRTLHRVATATPGCHLDAITPATFVHFFKEAQALYPTERPCQLCLPAE